MAHGRAARRRPDSLVCDAAGAAAEAVFCARMRSSVRGATHLMDLKARSTFSFCFEPPGKNPSRKSMLDALLSGCIPVFFNEMTDALFSSWVYPNTATLSRVLVPREPFLARQVSLKALLESVPPPLLLSMRRAVALNARHLQLSLDDDPHDLLPWLLHRIRTHGRDAEKSGA